MRERGGKEGGRERGSQTDQAQREREEEKRKREVVVELLEGLAGCLIYSRRMLSPESLFLR